MKLVLKNIHRFICVLLVMFNVALINAQNDRELPFRISTTTTLDTGVYVVKGKSVVEKGATLNVLQGTRLVFEPNALIIVRGGLNIKGSANNFVLFESRNNDQQGLGFEIHDGDKSNIDVSYARFDHLQKPILFNKNWGRLKVDFKNNQFVNLSKSGVYFEIRELDKIITESTVVITLQGNTFANNSGSIMFAEASADILKLIIRDNVFSRNEFIGRDLNGIFTTPIFLNYNATLAKGREPIISNNSVCFNYGSQVLADTVEFFPVHLTAVGSADFMDINQNYFGAYARENFDDYMDKMISTQRVPLLLYNDLLKSPPSNINGHIYQMSVDGEKIAGISDDVAVTGSTQNLVLLANRTVKQGPDYRLSYAFIGADTIRYEKLEHDFKIKSDNQVEITIKDHILKSEKNGFIKVEGLVDDNGFVVPAVHIGLKQFLIKNNVFISGYEDFARIPKILQSTPRLYYQGENPLPAGSDTGNLILPEDIEIDDTILRKNYWDIGILIGSTLYFGDLAYTNISLSLPNLRPNLGIRLGYTFTDRFRIEVSQNNMILAGADDRSSIIGSKNGTNFDRGLSFRTQVHDLGIVGEYRWSRFKKLKNIIPSFYAGVAGYYFNPQAEVDGVYYNLRPIGTEGQTLNGKSEAYSQFGFAIPMGVKLTRHLNDYTMISLSYSYHKLFTDYLDDVSTGNFQTDEDIIAANPNLAEVAVKLANPKGKPAGTQRSASGDNDGFSYLGFTFTRKLNFNK